MNLTDAEKAMMDGSEGRAKAKAMELLVRYGEALGAERLVETRTSPAPGRLAASCGLHRQAAWMRCSPSSTSTATRW